MDMNKLIDAILKKIATGEFNNAIGIFACLKKGDIPQRINFDSRRGKPVGNFLINNIKSFFETEEGGLCVLGKDNLEQIDFEITATKAVLPKRQMVVLNSNDVSDNKYFKFVRNYTEASAFSDKTNVSEISMFLIGLGYMHDKIWVLQKCYPAQNIHSSRLLRLIQGEDTYQLYEGHILSLSANVDAVLYDGNLYTRRLDILNSEFDFGDVVKKKAEDVKKTLVDKGFIDEEGTFDSSCMELRDILKLVRAEKSDVLSIPLPKLISRIKSLQKKQSLTGKALYKKLKITENGKFDVTDNNSRRALLGLLNDEVLTSELTKNLYDVSGTKKKI